MKTRITALITDSLFAFIPMLAQATSPEQDRRSEWEAMQEFPPYEPALEYFMSFMSKDLPVNGPGLRQ